ncbi:NADH-quinone oxidoreductase subunit J [Pseudomonas stutzeri]|nr:NADH-quinone oxidoreductase subunit J [Stutzerimonas stutzeri]
MTEPAAGMAWLVVLPLAWACLAFLLGPGRGARAAIAGLLVQLALAVQLAVALTDAGPVGHAVGGWAAPLGIALAADGLAAALLLLAQLILLPLAFYARAYYAAGAAEARYFWPLLGIQVAGLNGLFLSADLFNLYVTLELVGLSAVGLVAAGGGAGQVAAALRYLFATLLGSGAYLLGVALVYGSLGTVSLSALAAPIDGDAPRALWFAGGLMLVGLMLKTALFPFHYWLPPAHGGAPAPVSALLSALVVKASFYLILRLWNGPFAGLAGQFAALAWLPMALGSAAILWGSWQAIRAHRLKMLIAYSTVAQLGYLFLIFPLLAAAGALQAGIMHAFAHGLAKAAMFAAAGAIIKATGQDTVAGVAGVAARLPLPLYAFGMAGATLAGLPPSAGFLAKWLLIDTALQRGHWIVAVVVLLGGLLAAVYVFRVLRQAFLRVPLAKEIAPVPRMLQWMAFLLAAASVLLGLRGVELVALLSIGAAR